MPRNASTWSTQQLTDFVVAVTDAATEDEALREAVGRLAEALDAEVVAVVRDGRVAASHGWAEGEIPVTELLSAAARGEGLVEIPGSGPFPAVLADLGESPGDCVLLARAAEPEFNAVESGLLRGMARTLALALRTLRSVEVLRERQRLLEGLSEIQRSIARRVPVKEVFEAVVDLTAELLGDELPALFLRDADDPGWLVIEACRGLDAPTLEIVRRRRVGEGVAGRAVEEDRL